MPKVNNVVLDATTDALVEDYAQIMGIDKEQAIKDLLRDGVQEVKKNARKALKNSGHTPCH